VPGRHSMRMFTEVGRRVQPHCTAVGKALLAQLPEEQAARTLGPGPLTAHTSYTVTEPAELLRQFAAIRERGYAVDDQEQELGVRCIAVVVPGAPTATALSVSGPEGRIRAIDEKELVATAQEIAARLGAALGGAPEAGDEG
ncbi:IclR family transcriptional regulator, partial [Streptodolium elevatio]